MASITDRGNGTFLVRVYNGVKNGKPQSVAVTFKANAGSSPAVARRAAEKYAALFEELVHSGGYMKSWCFEIHFQMLRRKHPIPFSILFWEDWT